MKNSKNYIVNKDSIDRIIDIILTDIKEINFKSPVIRNTGFNIIFEDEYKTYYKGYEVGKENKDILKLLLQEANSV